MAHPFRFGVQLSRGADGAAWRDTARRIEDLGYATLFVPDHFDDQFAPLVALTSAAEATTALTVGCLVLGNDYRHPVVLAKEAATLDLLAEGRFELGLGAGWMTSDYQTSGIHLDPPGVRVDRLAESIAVLKALWSGEPTTFSGAHYTVTEQVGTPRPFRRPHPTLIVGGGGRRVLTLAAREADIVGVNPSLAAGTVGAEVVASATPARYRERIGWLREAAGERFDELELQCLTFAVQVVPNPDEVLAGLAQAVGMSVEDAAGTPLALVGTVDGIVEILERRREELGFSYVVVHEAEIETFAPVVERLTGR